MSFLYGSGPRSVEIGFMKILGYVNLGLEVVVERTSGEHLSYFIEEEPGPNPTKPGPLIN